MEKEKYIANYLNKKMKNNKLPYCIQYLNLVADLEIIAEKKYNNSKKIKNKMINIPTSRELILRESNSNWVSDYSEFVERLEYAFREFARLHVEAALKEVTEKLYFRDSNGNCIRSEESNKLVLNVYPLNLIK
jgi:hypothetical protein